MLRILGIGCYALLAILILGFIFSNLESVAVEFFPFGSSGDMPLYILLSIIFAGGLIIGLIHSASVWAGMRTKLKRSERAVNQLEKELAARPPVRP